MSSSPNGSTHSSSGRENPTGHSSSVMNKRRSSRESPKPFYELPSWVPNVPSKIIKEARQSLRELHTTRPHTPRDDSRHTLSKLSHKPTSVSALSIDYDVESRPSSSRPADIQRRNANDPTARASDNAGGSAIPPSRLSKLSHQPSMDQPEPSDRHAASQARPPLPSYPQRSPAVSGSSTTKPSQHRISSSTTSGEAAEETDVWKNEIDPLIEILVAAHQNHDYEQFDRTSYDLYDVLAKHKLFGKKAPKKRADLLKTLFSFIECDSAIVRFHVARLSLAFRVSSVQNLRRIIMVTADLSRDKDNDHHFANSNLLDLLFESISRIDTSSNLESIGYFCTTLKNLTVNNDLIRLISEKKPFQLLKRILKELLQLKDQAELLDRLTDCLTSFTGTLRNLADDDENRSEFLSDDLIEQLTLILKYFTDKSHGDLMKNVARILSKLTEHTDCCLRLVQCSSCYRSFLKILIKHENNQALIVRVCFILGNMMAKSEEARLTFMSDHRALQTLTKLLQGYIQLDSLVLKPDKLDNDDSISQDADVKEDPATSQYRSIENVIMKVIRVLSNTAISPENGLIIIRREDCIGLLFKLLNASNQHSEELLVHVLMALNNLSYYDDAQSYIVRNAETLAQLLVTYIRNEEKMDCVIEAFRVLGNLSRAKKIRDVLIKFKVDSLAIHHCQSDNTELLYAVIGVLINLTVDEEKRECLQSFHGIDSLISIVEYSIQSDWQLSSLVCKALWNYSDNNYENVDVAPLWFTDEQLKTLFGLFEETLSESNVGQTGDEQLDHLNKQFWTEEYFPVASRLYQRLTDDMDYFQSIQTTDR